MNRRSPLGRVLSLGSAGEGTGAWLAQRVTSVALVPLGLWFVLSLTHLAGADYAQAAQWLAQPFNTVAMLLLLLVVAHHARLGLQVIAEDYLHAVWLKTCALLGITFVVYAATLAGAIAVLRVALGGAAS